MDRRVQQTIDRMEARLHQPLAIADLARVAGVSVVQLARLFREATGLTTAAFLHDLRMKRALTLIERTSLTITEVMVQVGISDRSQFARAFRRAYGSSPRTLRVHRRDEPGAS